MAIDQRYYAPFAPYDFAAFAFIIEKATNKSIPITVFAIGDLRPTDFDTTSTEVPARNNFTYSAAGGLVTAEVKSHILLGRVQYSRRVGALILFMFLLCWGLSMWSLYLAYVVWKRGLEAKDGVALLPITLIFSVPTIRSIYIGSVPFGALLGMYLG